MVKANRSCIYSNYPAWEPPSISCMNALPESRKPGCMTSFLNSGSSVASTLPRIFGPEFSGVPKDSHQVNVAYGLHRVFPSQHKVLLSGATLSPPNKASVWSHEHGGGNELHAMLGLSQKKFALFDHSGYHERLFYSGQNLSNNENALVGDFTSLKEKLAINPTQFDLSRVISCEEIDENHIGGEENEMHEDTEEINALLYSDDDDEDSEDSEGEEDEVMSTGHSPCVIGEVNAVSDQVEQIADSLLGSDYINKRQKLMSGGYHKVPPNDTTSVKLNGHHNSGKDSSPSFAVGHTDEEDALDNKRLRKAKIHQTLKILEGIIPGVQNKDPLVILDQAIDYLKAMKLETQIHDLSFR